MAIEAITPETDYVRNGSGLPQERDRAVEVLLNHPARAFTYLLVATNPEQPHTPAALGRRINALQQPFAEWPDMDNSARAYCSNMLVPAELLKTRTIYDNNGRPTLAYVADPKRLPLRIATAVAGIDWELRFPHLQSSRLLGDTRLNVDEAMPLTSLKIYEALLDNSRNISSLGDLQAYTGRPLQSLHRCLRTLVRNGSITKQSKYSTFHDRRIALEDPGALYTSRYYKQLSRGGKALHNAAARLRSRGQTILNSASLVNEVASLQPEISEAEIRQILGRNPPEGIRYDDQIEFNGKPTRFKIAEELRPAVADLIVRYQNLQTNPRFARMAAARANEILHDGAAVALLIRKSRSGPDEKTPFVTQDQDHEKQLRALLGSLTFQCLPIEAEWQNRALCRAIFDQAKDKDDKIAAAEVFFPVGTEGPSKDQAEKAKKICRACPVAASCLQWAIDSGQRHGILGGLTEQERRKCRQQLKVPVIQLTSTQPEINNKISATVPQQMQPSPS